MVGKGWGEKQARVSLPSHFLSLSCVWDGLGTGDSKSFSCFEEAPDFAVPGMGSQEGPGEDPVTYPALWD